MRALVTGATGFIGGSLAAALARAGWGVSALVRPGSRSRLPAVDFERVIEASLGPEMPGLERELAGIDVVMHAAAIRNRWGNPAETYRYVNLQGTRRLLEASVGQARRFVYISSVGVYGCPGTEGIDESFPHQSLDGAPDAAAYHASKAAAEGVVRQYQRQIETVIVRPTITYGPGDRDGMLTRLAQMMAKGRFVAVGSGRNLLHLTYIDDLVNGLLLAAEQPAAAGEDFILAGPQPVSPRQLTAQIARTLGLPGHPWQAGLYIPETLARGAAAGVEAVYQFSQAAGLPVFGGEPPLTISKINTICRHRSFSDIKARQMLGYGPQVGCETGIRSTVSWMRSAGLLEHEGGGRASASPRRVAG